MKKIISILGISIITLLAFTVLPVQAWDFSVSGTGVCNEKTGEYDLTFSITNPEDETATIADSDRPSVSGTIPANTTKDYTESVAGNSTSESLTVELDWPSDSQQPPETATIDLDGDCEAPEPPKEEPKVEPKLEPTLPTQPQGLK